jgi:hypothetical protein
MIVGVDHEVSLVENLMLVLFPSLHKSMNNIVPDIISENILLN